MAKSKEAQVKEEPKAAQAVVEEERDQRKTFEGVVVSDKMDKTRIVSVPRSVRHRFYEKIVRKNSKFAVHDETNASKEGDWVEIMSTRPLSKTKRWRLVRVVKAAPKTAVAEAVRP